jgi:putative acyl-CoA dehydrogenase
MIPLYPIANLSTHEVLNMPPHLSGQDLWQSNLALREAVTREGVAWPARGCR